MWGYFGYIRKPDFKRTKLDTKTNGLVNKLKSLSVAKGYRRQEGDYFDTYAYVARIVKLHETGRAP